MNTHNGRALLTPCQDSSTDLERQIRSYCGGILELKSPIKLPGPWGTLEPPLSDTSLSSRNSESDSVSVADPDSDSDIGHWTVLPLHRTVLEFLRQPDNMTVVITAQIASKNMWEPWGDGHLFILKACQTWLRLSNIQEVQHIYSDSDVVLHVTYHSHRIERMAEGKRPYPWPEMQCNQLLDDIDAQLCARKHYKDCWPYYWAAYADPRVQKQWRFDFVAYAVYSNMPLLVKRRIKEGAVNVNRDYGLPLLHFSLICFDDRRVNFSGWSKRTLQPAMTKLLLDHGAVASRTYDIYKNGKNMDSLAFLIGNCLNHKSHEHELDADDVEQLVVMLLENGANPNSRLSEAKVSLIRRNKLTGLPVLYVVTALGLPRYNLLIILKKLITCGADPNALVAPIAEERTLLDFLFINEEELHFDGWLWLLDHGATISKILAEILYSADYSEHALLDPACRKAHYYDKEARPLAEKYNPSWRTASLRPRGLLHRIGDWWS